MKELFNQLVANFNKHGIYLISANILLVFFLILLNNFGVLPIKNLGDFAFFSALFLILALYRPGWSFLFFIGTIALENIIVTPPEFPIQLRPYQLFGSLIIFAIAIRFLLKRLNFKLVKLNLADYLVILIAIASYITAVFSADKTTSFKQSLVLTSFAALYFLVRIFVQNSGDLKKIIPFFLSSSVIVVIYGIWQNVRFMRGLNSFETMPGRPNSTFNEPDWLGIFLVFLLAVIYSLVYFFQHCHSERIPPWREESKNLIQNKFIRSLDLLRHSFSEASKLGMTFLYVFLALDYLLLILTVSRSAWLGTGVVTLIFLLITLTDLSSKFSRWQWKQFSRTLLFIAIAIIWSIGAVYIFNLTNFQLFNRIQSVGTGLQKITVSCPESEKINILLNEFKPGGKIPNFSDVERYGCRHIDLEEIEIEKKSGNFVTEIYRVDPNINKRQEIYQKSWAEIKMHPILGIGWGNISDILGKDERGVGFNSSNIFLEVWLGSGILGLLAFIFIWAYILTKSIKLLLTSELEKKSFGLFLFLGGLAIIIPNLFNAGIFLGIAWLFFGIASLNINLTKRFF